MFNTDDQDADEMALQPSDDAIGFVMSVTSISRSEAINRLKNNNNNAEQAIGEFFDDGESARKKYANAGWDDSHFGADREGGGSSVVGTQGVSFQVQGPDDYGPNGAPGRFSDAMSRPPSRVTNRSPLGNVIDLTADSATGGSHPPMYYGADSQQEDDELERALAASREEAGLPPQPQQYGITQTTSTTSTTVNVNEVHFGPATQTDYEREKWAMVPSVKINTQTVIADPDAADRKRDIDAPAFLKPSMSEHRLAGLLMMYHAIPMTRELFVDRDTLAMTYGSDQDWWNGSSTIKLESVGAHPSANVEGEVRLELQRLMALLDKTDRSYGSVDALANMGDVKRAQRNTSSREVDSAVLQVWARDNTSRPSRVSKIFSHGVSSETRRDRDEEFFAILDLTLPRTGSNLESIYDIADHMLWPKFGSSDPAESAYLEHVADVFVFRLNKEASDTKPLDIPAIWYPDRYMLENREAALEMRMAKKEAYEDILRLQSVEETLTVFQTRNGKEFKIGDLLKTSMRHDEAIVEAVESEEDEDEDIESSFRRSGKTAGLTAKLQLLLDSIDRKLQALKEEKEKTLETMRKLSLLYTSEDSTPNPAKLNKYYLRGVSTKNDVTYICRRAEPDLIEMDLDAESPRIPGDQWWRCAFLIEKGNPRVSVEKTSEEEVLHAAKYEAEKQVLLMYASEAALREQVLPLPPVLENFVKLDNQYFKREFPSNSDVTSPGKRKFDDSDDHGSPTTRDSDREYRLNGETDLGWTGVQSASKELNENLEDVDGSIGDGPDVVVGKQQEMQQRVPGPMLSQGVTGGDDSGSLLDRMDVDDENIVLEENVVDSSAAVKKVRSRS